MPGEDRRDGCPPSRSPEEREGRHSPGQPTKERGRAAHRAHHRGGDRAVRRVRLRCDQHRPDRGDGPGLQADLLCPLSLEGGPVRGGDPQEGGRSAAAGRRRLGSGPVRSSDPDPYRGGAFEAGALAGGHRLHPAYSGRRAHQFPLHMFVHKENTDRVRGLVAGIFANAIRDGQLRPADSDFLAEQFIYGVVDGPARDVVLSGRTPEPDEALRSESPARRRPVPGRLPRAGAAR